MTRTTVAAWSAEGQTLPFGRHAVVSAVHLKADRLRVGAKVSEVPFSDNRRIALQGCCNWR